MGRHNELKAYQLGYELAMEVFTITKNFPSEEKYGLTSQIRRSSRSVCSNLAEGYRKRDYPAHFKSKLTDALMENTETEMWLDFALSCEYINFETMQKLKNKAEEVGKLLSFMQKNIEKFL